MAPTFKLFNNDGEECLLKDYRGNANVVLYFYPKAMTPGCTVQACGIRDSQKLFENIETVVLGISPDPVSRLQKFIEKGRFKFFVTI